MPPGIDTAYEYNVSCQLLRKMMTFETINWEAELQRITMAFDVVELCQFVRHDDEIDLRAIERETDYFTGLLLRSGCYADISYNSSFRFFSISDLSETNPISAYVRITWDGINMPTYPLKIINPPYLAIPLAKALFHLDLLTLEIEESLKVSISAHQKTEWTLGFTRLLEATGVIFPPTSVSNKK